jgi:hypothetical protein
LAFPLEYEKQAKKSQNITFFIFDYPFSSSIGDALRIKRKKKKERRDNPEHTQIMLIDYLR